MATDVRDRRRPGFSHGRAGILTRAWEGLRRLVLLAVGSKDVLTRVQVGPLALLTDEGKVEHDGQERRTLPDVGEDDGADEELGLIVPYPKPHADPSQDRRWEHTGKSPLPTDMAEFDG
jgi:hypothetical protein